MKHEFGDKRAILTGGTSDEGRLIGEQLLEQGMTSLALLDTADPNGVCNQLRTAFPDRLIVFVAVADLSRRHNVREAFDAVFREFGSTTFDVMLIGSGRGNFYDIDGCKSPAMNQEARANLEAATAETSHLIASINVIYEAIDAMSITRGGHGGLVVHLSQPTTASDNSPKLNHQSNWHHTDQTILSLMRSLSQQHFHQKHAISFVTFCRRLPPPDPTSLCAKSTHISTTIPTTTTTSTTSDRRSYNELGIPMLVSTLATAENGSVWRMSKGTEEQLSRMRNPNLHSRIK